MEEATIGNNNQQGEGPMYQQGRFPSVVDTDDLVFELGKQTVQNLNNEKLLNKSIRQIESADKINAQLNAANLNLGQKVKSLEESNGLYQKNNQTLDAELVSVRADFRNQMIEIVKKEEELKKKDEEIAELKEQLVKKVAKKVKK